MSKMAELDRQTRTDDIAFTNSQADKKYNGWTNYETWNVMLWINNDMVFYHQLKEIIQENDGNIPYNLYEIFAMKNLRTDFSSTGDGISLYNKKINKDEINEHLHEMFTNDDSILGEK